MMMKMLPTAAKQYIAQTRTLFYCQCKIKIPMEYGEELLDQCFGLLEEVDRKYNSYQAGSYFELINKQRGNWVEVDDACIRLLQTIKLVSALTQGRYDISCMPLMRLWGFYRPMNDALPSREALDQTLTQVDYRLIELGRNRVRIGPTQELITGSFIKAFAVDQVVAFLKTMGVTDAIINAGGSTIRAINDDSHPNWHVNIPDTLATGLQAERLAIRNQTFSLSAAAHNHLAVGDKKYGHILDCSTGMPANTVQVGVITEEAFLGDVLSTALFTVGASALQETAAQLMQYFDFDYFRIEADGSKTSGKCF